MANNVFVSFDFGLKRIGVAVGQKVTLSATPLNLIRSQQGKPNWQEIEKVINQWQPDELIVGLPLKTDESELSVTNRAKKFSNQLKERFKRPVHLVDERYTTVEARQLLFDEGGYKALSQALVDSYAAKLMLEQWLNSLDK